MSIRRQNIWPVINPKCEDALFTIVLHPDVYLYKAGGKIHGHVYVKFKDTKEEISFDILKVFLKENVNLPEGSSSKKNVTAKVVEELILVDRDKASHIYDYYATELNESNDIQIPFEFLLPLDLSSSFNSKQVTVCYEIKAEICQLRLCGEVCDLNTSQSIEIKESLSEVVDEEQSSQIQQAVGSNLWTFSANTDRTVYHTDDEVKIDILLDVPNIDGAKVEFEVVQIVQLKRHSQWQNVISQTEETYQIETNNTGIFSASKSIFLENSVFSSQPSVRGSDFIEVSYIIHVISTLDNNRLEIELPIIIEREHALGCLYQRNLSTENLPLLPLTITVNELKNDGLQSYIPLKQYYENRRLSVRKGNIQGLNAVLTIVSESYNAYTSKQKIKGYVYLKVKNTEDDLNFSSLIILLVGVMKFKHGSTLRSRNGEMFLYKRKILKGDNNNNFDNILSKKSGLMVVEFEFDLSKIQTALPPTFNSEEISILYELKADVFNLSVAGKKASLYTTLPVILKEEKPQTDSIDTSGLRTMAKLNGKDIFVFLSTEKSVYFHNDVMQIRINIDNKSKKQLSLKVQLVQILDNLHTNRVVHETIVSTPIILLVLPRSKLISSESISLRSALFHHQPSVTNCDSLNVTYKLTIEAPILNAPELTVGVPITLVRRYGHTMTELTREGYPLLPLTLELYGKAKPCIPSYLKEYSNKGLLKLLNSSTCVDRWKGWKIKSLQSGNSDG